MSSPYYSVVPRNQKPYATPWFQRQYSDTQISIEEELENAISQLVIENDISRVPSSDAIYKFLLTKLRSVVLTSDPNVFQEQNTFMEPINAPANVDMINNANDNLIPNSNSIKNYLSDIITSLNSDLVGYIDNLIISNEAVNYVFTSNEANTTFLIQHNLNSQNVLFNVQVLDENTMSYKNDIVHVEILDNNSLLVETNIEVRIKIIVIAIKNVAIPG
jgi:hypothetical protein